MCVLEFNMRSMLKFIVYVQVCPYVIHYLLWLKVCINSGFLNYSGYYHIKKLSDVKYG